MGRLRCSATPSGAIATAPHRGQSAHTAHRGPPFTIIGVAPPGFFGLEVGKSFDVAVPFGAEPLVRGRANSRLDARGSWWLNIAGRLEPGQTLAQAGAGLRALEPAIRGRPCRTDSAIAEHFTDPLGVTSASTGVSWLRDDYRPALFILTAVVGLVLALPAPTSRTCCWRGRRRGGTSLRYASRWGRRVGGLCASCSPRACCSPPRVRWSGSPAHTREPGDRGRPSSSRSPVFVDVSVDWRVLLFTVGVALATVVLFGMGPALRSTRVSPNDVLKAAGRGSRAAGRASTSRSCW